MAITYVFKRTEKKYRISVTQAEALKAALRDVLLPDEFGQSTVGNLYLDTPDFLLIRNSLDAITYKEKLRIRSYGTPQDSTKVFLELKKKYKGIVYKRRIALPLADAHSYLTDGIPPTDGQIMKELDYAMHFYRFPQPRVALFYEREAYTWQGEDGVRLTLDTGVRFRDDDLFLQDGSHGTYLLPENTVLLEVKCGGAMPLRLAHLLDRLAIFPTRYSKYGTAYRTMQEQGKCPQCRFPVSSPLPSLS